MLNNTVMGERCQEFRQKAGNVEGDIYKDIFAGCKNWGLRVIDYLVQDFIFFRKSHCIQ